MVDSSSSIGRIFELQRAYVRSVVSQLNIAPDGDNVALIVYSGKLRHFVKHSFQDMQHKEMVELKVDGELNLLNCWLAVISTACLQPCPISPE